MREGLAIQQIQEELTVLLPQPHQSSCLPSFRQRQNDQEHHLRQFTVNWGRGKVSKGWEKERPKGEESAQDGRMEGKVKEAGR